MEWHNQLTNVISTMWDIYYFRLCTMQPLNYGKRFPYFILHATLLSHTHLYWFSFKFIIAAFVAPLTNVHSLSLEEVNSPRYERIRRIFSIQKLCNNNRICIGIQHSNFICKTIHGIHFYRLQRWWRRRCILKITTTKNTRECNRPWLLSRTKNTFQFLANAWIHGKGMELLKCISFSIFYCVWNTARIQKLSRRTHRQKLMAIIIFLCFTT